MKKTFLNKLLVGFSALLFFAYTIIYACGGGDNWNWWADKSNFTPETFVDESYTPLFLSSDVFYTNGYYGFDTAHNSRFNTEIISDWSTYVNKKINNETLHFFITVDSSDVELTGINNFIKSNKPNAFSKKWASQLDYNDKKTKNLLEFLSIAKKIEKASVGSHYWSYEPEVNQNKVDSKTIAALEKRFHSETDAFLKNRYWFQTVKARFYSADSISVVKFFNATESTIPKNTLYYRALAYVAGINYKQKNYALSNYQYSIVFDKCPAMRIVAAYCFHPQEATDWNQSLAMAKSNEEKAALWAVQGYYRNEVEAIEKIYDLQPKSEHLDYLLTRLINVQEANTNPDFNGITVKQNRKLTKDTLNKAAINLVDRIAKSGKTSKPYLWNIAAGYMQTLNENFKQAEVYFDLAEKQMPKTDLAKNQLRLLRFVNNLSSMDELNSKNEAIIVSDLNWLYFELPKNEKDENVFRYYNASSWSKKYISAMYKSQKNKVLGELFDRNNDFYIDNVDLEAMKSFLKKSNKSEIEQIAVKIYDLKLDDLYKHQAVMATFKDKISDAIEFMKQTDSVKYEQFPGNPFNGNIKDCNQCDYVAKQKRKYNQLEFLTTIKIMQDNIEKGEDVYNNAMLIGNAFYSITHFGNGRSFHETEIIGYGCCPDSYSERYKELITNCTLAKSYYQKALAAATNDEQKAKCHYMLAKCERNDYYLNKYVGENAWWGYDRDKFNFRAWNGFKALKKDFSKTKYYQDVIRECGYFDVYINGPRP